MYRFDLVDSDTASLHPGHIIVIALDSVRITGKLAIKGQSDLSYEEPPESTIHMALPFKQKDALAVAVRDDKGLWPERPGQLVHWNP
ncbi:hypothetical protein [Rhizobium anhuiense]|jgi:hypothetical protein